MMSCLGDLTIVLHLLRTMESFEGEARMWSKKVEDCGRSKKV